MALVLGPSLAVVTKDPRVSPAVVLSESRLLLELYAGAAVPLATAVGKLTVIRFKTVRFTSRAIESDATVVAAEAICGALKIANAPAASTVRAFTFLFILITLSDVAELDTANPLKIVAYF